MSVNDSGGPVPADRGIGATAGEVDGLPEPPQTGDDMVDGLLLTLVSAMGEALDVQAEVFDETHQALQGRLADVER